LSEGNRFVEPLLRRLRFQQTIRAARNFDATATVGSAANGDEFFRMRSAMDIRPTAGREMSQRALNHPRGGWPTRSQAATSTFVPSNEINACVESLRANGFYVFEQRIPAAMVDSMRESALTVPAMARGLADEPAPYPRTAPQVGRYDIDEVNTMASSDMQDYCSDPAFALIAAEYLEQPVIQDQTALWWTTTMGAANASMNAWLFHQDRDRLSFLKFFCYLTDVGPENGPHTYIRGTHKQVPHSLATDGRKDDNAIREAGLWDDVVNLCGPAGTLMAVDTVGLHKGQPPISGDRCVLQVEYATSLFGAVPDYPDFAPSQLSTQRYKDLTEVLQRWGRSFAGQIS
jgi:hypothetical protein